MSAEPPDGDSSSHAHARAHIRMSHLHKRTPPAALNIAMAEQPAAAAASAADSREPLLSPASRSTDHSSDSGDEERRLYGSTSSSPKDDRAFDVARDAAHSGVQQADAVNLVWSKSALALAYVFIFLSSFANGLQYQIMSALMPYVVSEFSSHSLIPTIGIVASIASGILKLPVAKMIDSWGRPQGLAFTTLLATVGLILMALCTNVRMYAAAEVIYQVGISGFTYVLDIIISDTSSLRNRVLAFAFNSSPTLITTFLGPAIAAAFFEKSTWRWAFGSSAIALTLLSLPIVWLLISNTQKAKAKGYLAKPRQPEPWTMDRFHKTMDEFDVIGIFLLGAGMTLILVPLSLVGATDDGRSVALSTALMALGVALVVGFALHERRAPSPFIRFSLLLSRNVAGACMLSVVIFVAYFAWDGYYTSYLQVVHNLSLTEANYIGHLYGFGACLWAIVVGYLIRRTDRFKWLAVAALPVHIVGGALMIAFRRPDTHIGWVIFCQVLITIGGSTLVVCMQMAIMAVASHAELASVVALLSLSSYGGSAMGSALSGAIWNSTLPEALGELLRPLGWSHSAVIALGSDLKMQMSYPLGDPIRDALIAAYGQAQVRMCVTGTLISLLEIVAVLMWRDVRLSESTQVKGNVI